MLKNLIKDTAIYGLGDFIFRFVGFAVFPIYAHAFSVQEFGVMALVTTLAGLIGIFVNLGLNNAVQRFYWDPQIRQAHRPLLVSTGLWVLCLWSTGLTALSLLLLLPFKEGIAHRFDVLWIFIVLALLANIPSEMLQYSLNILRLHFSAWLFTVVSAWKNLAGVLLGLYLILHLKKGLLGFFWGNLWALVVAIPLSLWLIRRDLTLGFDKPMAREVIAFGYPFLFAGLATWMMASLDRWMLGVLSNNTQVGLYSIAYKFATILIFLNGAVGQAWSPFAMKLYADGGDYRTTFSRALTSLFLGLTLVGVPLALFGPELLRLTTPSTYWPAADAFGVLAMGMVFAGTTQITALGISIERKTQLFWMGSWLVAILNVGLNYVMIPRWGASGAGAATLISQASLTGLYLRWTQRLHPLPLETRKLLVSLMILLATVAFSLFVNGLPWNPRILGFKTAFFCTVTLLGVLQLPLGSLISLRGRK